MERAAAGLPTEQKANRIRTVADVIEPYLKGYKLSHRPKSVLFANGRLAKVKKALGNVVLSDLTDERIRDYIRQRKAEKISGRTINMEVGELSRQSASLGLCYGPRFAGSKSVKTWVVRFPMTNRSAVAGIRLRQQTEESTGNFEVVPVKVPVPEQLLPIQ